MDAIFDDDSPCPAVVTEAVESALGVDGEGDGDLQDCGLHAAQRLAEFLVERELAERDLLSHEAEDFRPTRTLSYTRCT